MKKQPNISVLKNEKLLNYVKQKVLSDLVGNPLSGSSQDFSNDNIFHSDLVKFNTKSKIISVPKGKSKLKQNVLIPKKNFDAINQHRKDMMKWANREFGIYPNLLAEHSTYYVLTISTYKLLFNNETPTSKDFDIYCNGLQCDKDTYNVEVSDKIVITLQKSEAVDGIVGQDFNENSFEIVSKWDWKLVDLGDVDSDGEEDWLDTEDYKDIILE
jgi:hypothetical protein